MLKIIYYGHKEVLPLTIEEIDSHMNQISVLHMEEEFCYTNKRDFKARDYCLFSGIYWGAAHSIYDLRYDLII